MEKILNIEAEKLAKSKAAVLVDVREPHEYAAEHASGAVSFPLSQVDTRWNELTKEAPYLLMCGGGTRAGKVATKLLAEGFTHVRIVDGGFRGWKAQGLPTEKSTD